MAARNPAEPRNRVFSPSQQKWLSTATVTLFGMFVVSIFLTPLAYMTVTSFKTMTQIQDQYSWFLPRSPITYTYEGKDYPLLNVPVDGGSEVWALVKPGRESSEFIDPDNPEAGLIPWEGRWRVLKPSYQMDMTLENYPASWEQVRLGRLMFNTLFIAIVGTIATVISSTIVAYGFSRFRIPGIEVVFIILISTIILPRQVTLIPTYIFFRILGWAGTWLPLIIPHFFANAYNVFLLRQYFRSIPKDMDEAAMLDGANRWQILTRVIIPQSWPVIIAVSLFHFFFAWNDFFEPLVYLQGKEHLYTISIGLTQFNNIFRIQPGLAMAAALMTVIIPVGLFFVAQRVFVQGIVITGVDK